MRNKVNGLLSTGKITMEVAEALLGHQPVMDVAERPKETNKRPVETSNLPSPKAPRVSSQPILTASDEQAPPPSQAKKTVIVIPDTQKEKVDTQQETQLEETKQEDTQQEQELFEFWLLSENFLC